jgi:hypothetical protein
MILEGEMYGWSEVTYDSESERSVDKSFNVDDASISTSYRLLDADLAIYEPAPPIDHTLHTGWLLLT